MGTDIHAFCEILYYKSGKWKLYGEMNDYENRNYDFFGYIAGVRHDQLQVFSAKGLPKDLSVGLKDIFDIRYADDSYHHSFINLKNLLKKPTKKYKDSLDEDESENILSYQRDWIIFLKDVVFELDLDDDSFIRVVFWFDN